MWNVFSFLSFLSLHFSQQPGDRPLYTFPHNAISPILSKHTQVVTSAVFQSRITTVFVFRVLFNLHYCYCSRFISPLNQDVQTTSVRSISFYPMFEAHLSYSVFYLVQLLHSFVRTFSLLLQTSFIRFYRPSIDVPSAAWHNRSYNHGFIEFAFRPKISALFYLAKHPTFLFVSIRF